MTATLPQAPIQLYRYSFSGHSHRVELLLSLMHLPFEMTEVDLLKREQFDPAYLRLNPFGQVPSIVDGEVVLGDSNSILVYLAEAYGPGKLYPASAAGKAQVQRWLSIAAGPLFNGLARARRLKLYGIADDPQPAIDIALRLLGQLEAHLEGRATLVGEGLTIADVAMYTYVAHAPEGGISLDPYPRVRAWLSFIERQDGFVPMARFGSAAD